MADSPAPSSSALSSSAVSSSELNIDELRLDTPGAASVVHFNNAGSALPPSVVVDTVVAHLRREAEIGGYEAAAEATPRTEAVYASIAELIGSTSSEVALVENATRAWEMAAYAYPFQPGDRVLTGRSEYVSNLMGLRHLQKRFGFEIVLIDDDEFGQIDLEELERELAAGAAMVSLTHLPTSGGLVNPAAEVGERCRAHGTFFLLDACQAVGQVPISVDEIGCDALAATGRKYLRGPRGTGFLYVRSEWLDRLEPPFVDLHSADWAEPGPPATSGFGGAQDDYRFAESARRFETWEGSVASKLGLGVAVDYALGVGLDRSWPRVEALGAELRNRLGEVAGVTVHDKGETRGGIVTFSRAGVSAEETKRALSAAGINTSVSPSASARLDLAARELPDVVRASVHYYNTKTEIDQLIDALAF